MRHRRAERCVLRAEVALEAGFEEDAKESLAEAKKLDSNTPELETLRNVVAECQRAALAANHAARTSRVRRYVVAAAAVVLTIGGSVSLLRTDPGAVNTISAAAAASPSPSAEETSTVRTPVPAADLPDPREHAPIAPRANSPDLPRSRPVPSALPPVAPVLLAPVTAGLVPNTVGEVAQLPAPQESGDEPSRVRSVLSRYEAAYTALNLAAAQRFSLGQCALAIDGGRARADCDGTATWTPKAGEASRTEIRHWKFELKKTAGAWEIVRAEAR